MKKSFKLLFTALSFTVVAACGGGGGSGDTTGAGTTSGGTTSGGTTAGGTTGGGTTGGGTSGGGTTPAQTNTAIVLNYIDVRRSSVQSAFMDGEKVIDRSLAASGGYMSGAHYSRSADNYVATIQSFLNDSITYSRSMNALLPVDSASVAALLRTYKTQDANYVTTYYSSVNWGLAGSPSLTSVINDIKVRVNTVYDAAISNLP